MGSNTICKLIFPLLLLLAWPGLALAQQPEPTPNTPYHFDPVTIPDAPHEVPMGNFNDVDFINSVGSYALTVLVLLDSYNVLGSFVVILVSCTAVWWVYGFVTKRRSRPTRTNDTDDDSPRQRRKYY